MKKKRLLICLDWMGQHVAHLLALAMCAFLAVTAIVGVYSGQWIVAAGLVIVTLLAVLLIILASGDGSGWRVGLCRAFLILGIVNLGSAIGGLCKVIWE